MARGPWRPFAHTRRPYLATILTDGDKQIEQIGVIAHDRSNAWLKLVHWLVWKYEGKFKAARLRECKIEELEGMEVIQE